MWWAEGGWTEATLKLNPRRVGTPWSARRARRRRPTSPAPAPPWPPPGGARRCARAAGKREPRPLIRPGMPPGVSCCAAPYPRCIARPGPFMAKGADRLDPLLLDGHYPDRHSFNRHARSSSARAGWQPHRTPPASISLDPAQRGMQGRIATTICSCSSIIRPNPDIDSRKRAFAHCAAFLPQWTSLCGTTLPSTSGCISKGLFRPRWFVKGDCGMPHYPARVAECRAWLDRVKADL